MITRLHRYRRNYTQFRNITYSNRPDRVAQLAEHWASIPKVVGSIPTVARHIFQACSVWIYTQSNSTSIVQKCCILIRDYFSLAKNPSGGLIPAYTIHLWSGKDRLNELYTVMRIKQS